MMGSNPDTADDNQQATTTAEGDDVMTEAERQMIARAIEYADRQVTLTRLFSWPTFMRDAGAALLLAMAAFAFVDRVGVLATTIENPWAAFAVQAVADCARVLGLALTAALIVACTAVVAGLMMVRAVTVYFGRGSDEWFTDVCDALRNMAHLDIRFTTSYRDDDDDDDRLDVEAEDVIDIDAIHRGPRKRRYDS